MCNESHTGPGSAPIAPGLYVVATPIGNRGDLSPRARTVVESASLVLAEDTRSLRSLLQNPNLSGKALSLTEHNVISRASTAVEATRGAAVALISDAGTPGIADPGARLVAAAHSAGVPVRAVPGPSALAAALSVCGFEVDRATFVGFLPRKPGERQAVLLSMRPAGGLLVFYESPGRISATLTSVAEALNDPEVVVCRELTKAFEEVLPGRAKEMAARFADARGEFTVVVRVPREQSGEVATERAREILAMMKRAGARHSAAAAEVARFTGIRRADAHSLWAELE